MQKIINDIASGIQNTKVYEIIKPTNLDFAKNLSHRFNNNIYLKREDNTPIHSFKIRGAYQKIRSLSSDQLASGIITVSAGNHAQGVAISAKKLGIKAKVVMTTNTPNIKINAVKGYGAEVILHGENLDDAYDQALKIAKELNLVMIPPYDDKDVIIGQGTIAKELTSQLNNIDALFIPVGGGGLISGIASFVKIYYPHIKIIAVEPKESPTLFNTLQHNLRISLDEVGTFADGVAVKKLGKLPFDLLTSGIIDESILVSNDEICAAIKDIYNDMRAISEPAGALGIAGIKKYVNNVSNKNFVAIISGGNVNFDRLRYIVERAAIGEQSEAIFAVTIDETPGSFLDFCIKLDNYNITEFNYRFAANKEAHIFVGVNLDYGIKEKNKLLEKLANNFDIIDLSNNSIAKTHIRHMVGGRAKTGDELLYRFEFPEKKGALLKFLTAISGNYNISLFHYRNHGSAYGSVLVGFQTNDKQRLESILTYIGYTFHNETKNIAYQYFL